MSSTRGPTIRYNENGSLDEIVATHAAIHLEQMSDNGFWMSVRQDGIEVVVNLMSRGVITGRAEIEGEIPTDAEGTLPAQPIAPVLQQIEYEVLSAEAKWPPMNSAHEAYAVLAEEVDELWQHVKTNQKQRDLPAMRAEAIQVAAIAVRFVRDVCDGGRGRK